MPEPTAPTPRLEGQRLVAASSGAAERTARAAAEAAGGGVPAAASWPAPSSSPISSSARQAIRARGWRRPVRCAPAVAAARRRRGPRRRFAPRRRPQARRVPRHRASGDSTRPPYRGERRASWTCSAGESMSAPSVLVDPLRPVRRSSVSATASSPSGALVRYARPPTAERVAARCASSGSACSSLRRVVEIVAAIFLGGIAAS